MEVSHAQDYDTHAIIGGGVAESFQIAQTAEFFTVLSSTLYSNKELAVIREVLCNAWDSHIAAGILGTAVEIVLDENQLVIRDFGKGIPHNLVHQIYCVYGHSTKANDGTLTGGFGLGSKSPFSYTDHFAIDNCHEGTKVVHAISRGSGAAKGTPQRREIVSVPTTESGVKVTIPIKSAEDIKIFENHIRTVAKYGEMNVNLNGVRLEGWNLSESPEGFLIEADKFGVVSTTRIFIRYGNVIYPVENNLDYHTDYTRVVGFLDSIPRDTSNWNIVFQAPANSISVTPSRESISITDRTTESLKKMFEKIPSTESARFKKLEAKLVDKALKTFVKTSNRLRLLDGASPFLGIQREKQYNNYDSVSERIIHSKYRSADRKDVAKRLRLLAEENPKNKKQLIEVARIYDDPKQNVDKDYWKDSKKSDLAVYVARNITGPLVIKLMKDEKMNIKNLSFLMTGSGNRAHTFEPVQKTTLDSQKILNLLKNKVFISYGRKNISDSLYALKRLNGADMGEAMGSLVYLAPRTKTGYQDAIDFFTKMNYDIIDVVAYDKEHAPVRDWTDEPKEPKVVVPKILGIPKASNLIINGKFDPRGHMKINSDDQTARIEKPEWILQPENLSGAEYTHKFFDIKNGDSGCGMSIIQLWGDKGGIPVNSRQAEKYIKLGAKEGYAWIGERLKEEFETNQKLLDYFAGFRLSCWHDTGQQNIVKKLWKLSHHAPQIKAFMGFPDDLTPDEWRFASIWEHVSPELYRRISYYTIKNPEGLRPYVKEVDELIKKQPVNPNYTKVLNATSSKMFKYLNLDEMLSVMKDAKTPQNEKDEAETLLVLALQG